MGAAAANAGVPAMVIFRGGCRSGQTTPDQDLLDKDKRTDNRSRWEPAQNMHIDDKDLLQDDEANWFHSGCRKSVGFFLFLLDPSKHGQYGSGVWAYTTKS
jgi:hypothetical protein